MYYFKDSRKIYLSLSLKNEKFLILTSHYNFCIVHWEQLLSSPPLPSQEHNTPSLCPGQFLETGKISGTISKQISNRQTKTTAKIYAKVIPGKILKVQKLQLLLCISNAIKTVLSLRNQSIPSLLGQDTHWVLQIMVLSPYFATTF